MDRSAIRPEPTLLVGGTPRRVIRLSGKGARTLDSWSAGEPLGSSPAAAGLARALADAGLAHPVVVPALSLPPLSAVDVVIPVRDRPDGLRSTLDALIDSAGRRLWREVIVIDDFSLDPRETADVTADRAGVRVIRRQAHGGPAAARNTGWRATDAEIVVFVDSECVPARGWLDLLLPHFADPSVAAVAPRVRSPRLSRRPRRGAGGFDAVVAAALADYESTASPLDMGPDPAIVRPGSKVAYVPTAAVALRRTALESVEGFDETLLVGEDVDFFWRLAKAGWRIRYEPAAMVEHPCRPTLRSWLQQRHSYGSSAAALAAIHGSAVAPVRVPKSVATAFCLGAATGATAGASAAAIAAGASLRRLRRQAHLPARTAARVVVTGHSLGYHSLVRALRRSWWPGALLACVAFPALRRRLLWAGATTCLFEWATTDRSTSPISWSALRVADDVAYGAGVWSGAWRMRSMRAVLPATGAPRGFNVA